jgi:MoaA/NifB/PqqE/SkfB family radical SAM enzyme
MTFRSLKPLEGLIRNLRGLEPFRKKVIDESFPKPRRWRLLQVESAFTCNLRCIMCPWQDVRKQASNRGIMAQAVWGAIRPHLDQAQAIDFTGGGEPLLQPKLVHWIKDAKTAGCTTGLLTNGLLLKESLLQQLISVGIHWIGISMDGATKDVYEKIRIGSNFDTVCRNVANIDKLRNGPVPKTMINFVLMPFNFHQMNAMVRLAHQLGVDQVNFKQCDVIREEHGKGLGLFATGKSREIHRLEKKLAKARGLARKLKIQTTSFPFTPEEVPVCDQDPRNSMFIRYDGTVAPCINQAVGGSTTFLGSDVTMPRAHYGTLPQNDLLEVWQSKMCRFFRGRFHERVKTHEQTLTEMMPGSSSREKLLEMARRAMPPAPKGCQVCHYLYNI